MACARLAGERSAVERVGDQKSRSRWSCLVDPSGFGHSLAALVSSSNLVAEMNGLDANAKSLDIQIYVRERPALYHRLASEHRGGLNIAPSYYNAIQSYWKSIIKC